MLTLNEADVRAALDMPALIEAMERALREFSRGEVKQPLRCVVPVSDANAFAAMPVYIPSLPALGAKLVTVFPANAARGLTTHMATILLFSPETGELEAMVDGRLITEMRTAAVSAISLKYLARADARRLAILGSGVQAHSHLEAFACVKRFEEVRVWSPRRAARFAAGHPGVTAARSAEEAVRGADVVLLATDSAAPVFDAQWIGPGTHLISIGACRPNQREMDAALLGRAAIYVDSIEAAVRESGDLVQAGLGAESIRGELGAVAAGMVEGRKTAEEITVLKALGLAVEDVTAAHLAVARASRRIPTDPTGTTPQGPHTPQGQPD